MSIEQSVYTQQPAMSEREFLTSQREPPKDLAGVLDESAQTLFLTELWRGLALTMKVFWEPKVTINCECCRAGAVRLVGEPYGGRDSFT